MEENYFTVSYRVKAKRPTDATPEEALRLVESGKKLREIAEDWGITKARVSQLVKKARENADRSL